MTKNPLDYLPEHPAERKAIGFRMEESLVQEMEEAIDRSGVSMNSWLIAAVRHYLDALKAASPKKKRVNNYEKY